MTPPAAPPPPARAPLPRREPPSISRQSRLELPAPSTLAIERRVVILPRLVLLGRVVRPPPIVTLAVARRRVMS